MYEVGDLVKVCREFPSCWDGMIGEVSSYDEYGIEVTFFNGEWQWFEVDELVEIR